MSENKLAATRYRILDKCFSNPGRKYFIDDLIAACNEKLIPDYRYSATPTLILVIRKWGIISLQENEWKFVFCRDLWPNVN